MKKKSLLVLSVILLIISMIAIGWAIPTEAAQSANTKPEILKIGYITSLTGFASSMGIQFKPGALAAEDMINDQGGIVINGQPYLIKIIVEDTKTTVEGTVAATNKLVYGDKVKFIGGGELPFIIESEGTITEPAGVLRVTQWNCGMPGEFGKNTPNTFMAQAGAIENTLTAERVLTELYPGAKKIVAIMCDDGSVPYLGKKVIENIKTVGNMHLGDIVAWTPDTVDFAPIIVSVTARKPDAIHLVNGMPEHYGMMWKAAREQGFTGPVFWGAVNVPDVVAVAGTEAATDGFCIPTVTLDATDNYHLMKEAAKYILARSGKNKVGYWYEFEAFQIIWVLKEAIEAAQSIDPSVVRDTWEKMKSIESIYGPASIGGQELYGINHTVYCPQSLSTIMNGKIIHKKWVKAK